MVVGTRLCIERDQTPTVEIGGKGGPGGVKQGRGEINVPGEGVAAGASDRERKTL